VIPSTSKKTTQDTYIKFWKTNCYTHSPNTFFEDDETYEQMHVLLQQKGFFQVAASIAGV